MNNELSPSSPSLDSSPEVESRTDGLEQDGDVVLPESQDKERNGSASFSGPPRLASVTGLLMNQKTPKWNSTSSDSVASTPVSESDRNPSLTRTIRFDEEPAELRRTGSFGSLGGSHRRAAATAASAANSGKCPSSLGESDLRRFVFHHPRAKRMVSGLRVHAFTRQAFVSSFTVGLALGSVVAIVLKILKDVTCRMLYS